MSIKILVDSAADINQKEAEQLGIHMISMPIYFGTDEYMDGVDLDSNDFYNKLVNSQSLPKTSQINPYRFKKKFQELLDEDSEIICITLSSQLSGTYLNAKLSAEDFPDKVFVVDSMNASVGERLLCEYAIQLVAKGLNAKEIKKELDNVKNRINVIAIVDTLEYLKKGGRVSQIVAMAGKMLSIKPIIAIIDGKVEIIGKSIGSRRSNNMLTTLVEKRGGIDFKMPYCLAYTGFSEEKVDKYISESSELWINHSNDIPRVIVGATIGTHIGPGSIGIAFFANL